MRYLRPDLGKRRVSISFSITTNSISGCTNAIRSSSVKILRLSVSFDLRNFLLAGTLKKTFLTAIHAPTPQATTPSPPNSQPPTTTTPPTSSPLPPPPTPNSHPAPPPPPPHNLTP